MIFRGVVQDGKLLLHDQRTYAAWVRRLDGKAVEVEVKRYVRRRTIAQNAFYWGVVIELLAQHCGYRAYEMHDALKAQFLVDPDSNERVPRVRSSKDLTTEEFAVYVDRCIQLAAELGVVIPEPMKAATAASAAA